MSFNEFLQQRFEGVEGTEELRDITRHGLSGGVSGFIYYSELYTLFLDFEEEILEYVTAQTGMTFSDLAAGCDNLDNLAQKAVWMYVECWAHTEYEDRMTTLEELNDDNLNDLIQNSSYIRHPELNYAN